jgi:hypothetical protein
MSEIEGEEKPRKKPGPKPKNLGIAHDGESPSLPATASIDVNSVAQMNDLARRIWEGQSQSLPLIERVGRIRYRLKEKGFTAIDQLELPNDGYSNGYQKYL